MGYPFNKTWDRRMNTTMPVREIINRLPHVMISGFTIYRSTKLYEGTTDDKPGQSKITWENAIKGYFTEKEVNCMKWKFDLSDHLSVKLHAGEILAAVESRKMPLDEAPWSDMKIANFREWKNSDCP